MAFSCGTLSYSAVAQAPSVAHAPRTWEVDEARRRRVIKRLALEQERMRNVLDADVYYQATWEQEDARDNEFLMEQLNNLYTIYSIAERCTRRPIKEHSPISVSNRFTPLESLKVEVGQEAGEYIFKKPKYTRVCKKVKRVATRFVREKVVRPMCPRSPMLLFKLKKIIYDLHLYRLRKQIRLLRRQKQREYELECVTSLLQLSDPVQAKPEMDNPNPGPDGEGEVELEKDSNVVLTTQRDPSTSIPAPVSVKWSRWTSNDVVDDYATITSRWYQIAEFVWSKDDPFDKELARLILPRALLSSIEANSDAICDVPNTIPFKVHAYWRGDMEVRVQINSNKFQVGQLQATWYYSDHENLNISSKRSVYGFSQMDHALISASASNEAKLVIPFKHVYPFLPTRIVPDWTTGILDMGALNIRVIAPLRMSATGPTTCNVVVFIKLNNSEFTGTSSGKFYASQIRAKPEMDRILNLAEGLLNNTIGGNNMDNPSYQQSPRHFVPTGMHSLALGTNLVEPLHALRLDAAGTTQHPVGCAPDEDMTVSSIASRYGLIRQVQWKKDHAKGSLLLQLDADPFVEQRIEGTNPISLYWFAPVGVVSSMFMQWRGSLEYRFDIIASQFHTGRLIVGYVPGLTASLQQQMDYMKLKSSSYVVFDLQESNSFTFEVPYVSYRPWWVRKYGGNYLPSSTDAPSTLFMYVQVPLIPMEAVSDTIDINVYVRGGSSFEVCVPVQPSLGLNWNTDFILRNDEEYRAKTGYAPYYAGVWHSFNNSNSLVFRWGSASDQIAQWPTISVPRGELAFLRIRDGKQAAVGTQPWRTMVVWPSGHGYNIGIPTYNAERARQLAQHLYGGGSLTDEKAKQLFVPANQQGPGKVSNGNPVWEVMRAPLATQRAHVQDFEFIEAIPEGEESRNTTILDTTTTLQSSGFGRAFFGEAFNDLKTLMRRYQLYGQLLLSVTTDKDIDHCMFTFPCLPQGLALDIGSAGSPHEIFNRCRDGIIPLIASGYRFYRGDLRYKIVFPSNVNSNIWVQHRPDRRLEGWSAAKIVNCDAVSTGQGVYNHGYASHIQITRVNNVIELEVPFYNATCYNYLQAFNASSAASSYAVSLGEISVGFQATSDDIASIVNKPVTIYYSIGDGMQFSQWVGYQPMMILDQLPAPVVRAVPEGPIAKIKNFFHQTADEVREAQAAKMREDMGMVVQDVIGELSQAIPDLQQPEVQANVFSLVSQLVHAIIGTSLKTVAWAIVSIFVTLGLIGREMMHSVITVVKRLLEKYHLATQPQESANSSTVISAVPEAPNAEAEEASAWVSIIYNGVCNMLNVAAQKPKQFKDWVKLATVDFSNNCRGSNQVFVFFKNTFEVLKKMWGYVFCQSNPAARLLKAVNDEPEILKAWVKECLYLDDPKFRMRRAHDQEYIERVFAAHSYGQILLHDLTAEMNQSRNLSVFTRVYDQISKLKTDLMEMGSNPYIRRECFTICMCGASGIGKSYLTDSLCSELLRASRTPVTTGIKCVVNPLSDYWDQCDFQPVLCVDDMWSVETSTTLDKQLNMLFQVHSPIVLSPPKADLEGKKMRYNPEIFIYNTNKPFPRFDRIAMEAIYRRRNVLIECKASEEKKRGCKHCENDIPIAECSPKMLKDFHHIKFRYAHDVCNSETTWSEWMTYNEFLEWITPVYMANRRKANESFKMRVDEMQMLRMDEPLEGDNILNKYVEVNQRLVEEMKAFKERTLWSDLHRVGAEISASVKKALPTISITEKLPHWTVQCGIAKPEMDHAYEVMSSYAAGMNAEIEAHEQVRRSSVECQYAEPQKCQHWYAPLTDIYVDDKKLFWCQKEKKTLIDVRKLSKEDVTVQSKLINLSVPCGEVCVLHSKYFNYLFHKAWLCENPTWRLIYNGTKKGMPEYFMNCVDEISLDSKFGKVKVWLQAIIDKYLTRPVKMIRDFLFKWWPQVAYVLSLLGIIGITAYEMRNPKPTSEELADHYVNRHCSSDFWSPGLASPQGLKYSEAVTAKAPRIHRLPVTTRPQGSTQQVDAAVNKILQNMVYIGVVFPKVPGSKWRDINFRCLMLHNRQCLMLRHYIESTAAFPEGTKYYFKYIHNQETRMSGDISGIEIDLLNLPRLYYGGLAGEESFDSNIVLVTMPNRIPECKSIIKFIASHNEHMRAQNDGVLVTGDHTQLLAFENNNKTPISINADGLYEVILQGVYTYPYHGDGVCGSILLSRNLQRPIIGIHVAGTEGLHGFGVAEPLVHEMFTGKAIESEREPYDRVYELPLRELDESDIGLDTDLYPIGKVDAKLAHAQSPSTGIKKTLIHGTFDVRTEPNPMSSRDPRIAPHDPLKLGCEKHGMPCSPFNRKHLELATNHLKEKLVSVVKPINGCKIRSLQDAVCGVPGLDGFDSISWNTSAGFPLSSLKPPGTSGKRWLFDIELQDSGCYLLRGMRPELEIQLSTTQLMRKKGIKPHTIFTDCLKDTCLPVEKCRIPGKTRIFSISPVQFTIPFRQYYLDFMASYRAARLNAEHGIGIDVNSLEWTNLATSLSKYGTHIVTGDYKNFGPGLDSDVAASAFEIIIGWVLHYTEEDNKDEMKRVMWTMAQEILAPSHLCRDLVYRVPCGIPSGSPITDILNTISNCLLIRLAWLGITDLPLSEFSQNVVLVCYGDDLIMNVSDNMIDKFNAVTIGEFFSQYKMEFTDQDKSGNTVKWRTLQTATFLKHGFLKHPTRPVFLANLDKVSVEGTTNWTHARGLGRRAATIENAKQALELAFGWGPEYFNYVRSTIKMAFDKLGIYEDLITWEEMDVRCYASA
nr:MAG: polyprotein [Deformed wing virus]